MLDFLISDLPELELTHELSLLILDPGALTKRISSREITELQFHIYWALKRKYKEGRSFFDQLE